MNRQEYHDFFKQQLSLEEVRLSMRRNDSCLYSTYQGMAKLVLGANACHYSLGDSLTTKSHQKWPIVNNLFRHTLKDTGKLLDIYKKTLFNPEYSLFKDILPFITLVECEEDPTYSVFFYLNDSGRDLTNFERSQVMSFFLFSRLFTEHHYYKDKFLEMWDSGLFSFEECSIFCFDPGKEHNLPCYSTHWAFNGPDVLHCYSWLFRIGPNKNADHKESGLYVNNNLWANLKASNTKFDGSGTSKDELHQGVFGRYQITNKLTYEKEEDVGRLKSIRSFLDNYKKEYVR